VENTDKNVHFYVYSRTINPSKIQNLKSKIVTLYQIGDCAADKLTKRGETQIDRNPATAFQ
jgi:hypothetical protein